MHDTSSSRPAISGVTWFGLIIALFAMLLVRQAVFAVFGSPLTTSATVIREMLHWLCAISLLLIVQLGEGQPFSSIGIGTCSLARSLLWSIVIAFACLVI